MAAVYETEAEVHLKCDECRRVLSGHFAAEMHSLIRQVEDAAGFQRRNKEIMKSSS